MHRYFITAHVSIFNNELVYFVNKFVNYYYEIDYELDSVENIEKIIQDIKKQSGSDDVTIVFFKELKNEA